MLRGKVFGRLADEVGVTADACFLYEDMGRRRSTFTSLAHYLLAGATWHSSCLAGGSPSLAAVGMIPASGLLVGIVPRETLLQRVGSLASKVFWFWFWYRRR